MILLPLTYLGSIQFFSKLLSEEAILIEQHDNYNKQSFRNRCIILSANGPISLVIPVKRKRGGKTPVKDIMIDYDTDWRKLHWRGIISAYNSSPFFEYFQDYLAPFYTGKYEFLVDYCMDLTIHIIKLLDIKAVPLLSDKYLFEGDDRILNDFREIIHPKRSLKSDGTFISVPYTQVFSERFGFCPNLSILDLIFNTGPEASIILSKSLKK